MEFEKPELRNQESFIRGSLQYMQFTKGYIQYRVIWSNIHLCGLEISIKASRRYHGNHQEKSMSNDEAPCKHSISCIYKNYQSLDHLHTQSRSCNCSLSLDVSVLASRFVSSANITSVELFWMESWRSLMYKTNKVGRRTEPCGIPLVTCVHLDESSPTLTICLLPIRKLFIHPNSCPSMPYAPLWEKHGIKGLA